MPKTKIGIIGCGTIGSALAKAIDRSFRDQAVLSYLCDHRPEKARALKQKLRSCPEVVEVPALIKNSDLVIESASSKISAGIAKKALSQRKQVLVMSVGGLLAEPVGEWAKNLKGKLWVPSGAICGVDGLLAAHESEISRVRLITRKPPAGLREAPYFQTRKFPALSGKKEYCLFKGKAQAAVKFFPQNINIAAVLSLAGIGARKTEVEIWTSKAYRFNRHEVTIEGKSGTIQTVTTNVPSKENPKTSALAIYSAIATLRKIFSSVRIGT